MKIIFVILAILLTPSLFIGQTAISFMNNGGRQKSDSEGLSGFNPWLGAQLVHNFEGTKEFVDNIVISGKLLYEPQTSSTSFFIPIMGNLSDLKSELLDDSEKLKNALKNIVVSDNGLNVGIYPYFIIDDYAGDDFYFLAHGSLSWKMNGFQIDTIQTNYLNTGRVSAGIELGYGMFNKESGERPITLSITPVLSFFDKQQYFEVFGEEKSSLFNLEITGIIPISSTGIGLMVQSVISGDAGNVFRAGIILSGKSVK